MAPIPTRTLRDYLASLPIGASAGVVGNNLLIRTDLATMAQAVPAGGSTAQILSKTGNADYQMAWVNNPGSGSVQTVAVASANGFSGASNADPTNPSLTLSTTVTGVLKGNGTAISAAVAGTDYLAPAAIGTTVQAYSAALASWSGITRAAGFDAFVATPSSANLASVVTDETGTGALVFGSSPTIVTPTLTLKQSASPAPTAEGDIQWDTDDDRIVVGDGAGQRIFYPLLTGSFTPSYSATGSTFSYATQSGSYIKIGPVVHCWINMALNTSGNTLAANNLSLDGLPFTSAGPQLQYLVNWANSTTSYTSMGVRLDSGSTSMSFRGMTAAATTNNTLLTASAALHLTNGSFMSIYICYRTSA